MEVLVFSILVNAIGTYSYLLVVNEIKLEIINVLYMHGVYVINCFKLDCPSHSIMSIRVPRTDAVPLKPLFSIVKNPGSYEYNMKNV